MIIEVAYSHVDVRHGVEQFIVIIFCTEDLSDRLIFLLLKHGILHSLAVSARHVQSARNLLQRAGVLVPITSEANARTLCSYPWCP
jgi:hypothetical protein